MDRGVPRPPGSPHTTETTSYHCNREPAKFAPLLLLRCKGLFLRGTVSAFSSRMLPHAQTDSLGDTRGFATAQGVESTHIRSKEAAVFMPRKNLLSLFADFARFAGDVAVIQRRGYRREKLTYTELYGNALFWSRALAGRGVLPGDRVLLWGPNSAEWVACFWGILLRGGVVVPMDAAAAPDFVQRAIKDAGVKLILRDRQQMELTGAPPSMIIDDFKDVVDSPAVAADASVDPDDASTRSTIAEILYTSGTTAEPRGVVLTHGNFLANLEPLERGIDAYRKYERWFHPLRFVTLVPLSHVFGQFMALFVPPLLGAAVVFEPSSNPAEIIRSIKQERATALIAVPRMLDLLHAGMERKFEGQGKSEWLNRALENAKGRKFLRRAWMFRRIHRRVGWKFWALISGGAALSNETESFFKRMGYAVVQGYGMTETASLISLNHPFRATEGSVGKILPGREFKLAEDGEILVRGENVATGYWRGGAVQPSNEEGWLHTGDLGEVDAEGNLHFRGRKKNVIVTAAGLNVYPEDLENTLRKQPSVRDCVVIPFAHDGNAEPCAVLLMQDPDEPAARAAVHAANASLAEYERIRRWLLWPELDFPRTSTSKPRLPVIVSRAQELLNGQPANLGVAGEGGLVQPVGFTSPSGRAGVAGLLAKIGGRQAEASRLEQELNLTSLDR